MLMSAKVPAVTLVSEVTETDLKEIVVSTKLLRLMNLPLVCWKHHIFLFLSPDMHDVIVLRRKCRLFRDALPPPPTWTTYPDPKYPTLTSFMKGYSERRTAASTTNPETLTNVMGQLKVNDDTATTTTTTTTTSTTKKLEFVLLLEENKLESTLAFRKLIEGVSPIQQTQKVIDLGVLPQFVKFLKCTENPELQYQAAWTLTNIANGTSNQTRAVVNTGAVPVFVQLVSNVPTDSKDEDDKKDPHHESETRYHTHVLGNKGDVCVQAVWALGNIAGDSPQLRNVVLHAGVLQPLLAQLQQPNVTIDMLRNGTWALSNLCRGKPPPSFELVSPALPTLGQLIVQQKNAEVLTDACWAIAYLADGPKEQLAAVIESGVILRLVELLMHPSHDVQTPALRTIGNLVTGDDSQTQVVIDCSALPCLCAMLSSKKRATRKEACWTIANITAGSKDQIQAVIQANIIPVLIHLLTSHVGLNDEFDIKQEAVWAISNITSNGTSDQIEYLVARGCIPPLCGMLTDRYRSHNRVVMVALEGLENILKFGQSAMLEKGLSENPFAQFVDLEKINALQYREDEGIYEKSLQILGRYFGAVYE